MVSYFLSRSPILLWLISKLLTQSFQAALWAKVTHHVLYW